MEGRELSTDELGLLLAVGVDGTSIHGFSSGILLRFCLRGMQLYLERYEKKGEDTEWSDDFIGSDPRHNPSRAGTQVQMKQYWGSLLMNNFSLW